MTTKILLAYATRYGSTQEVATAIAGSLRKQGITVDLLPAKQVKSLQGYQALVLGAPLFMFHWHADALSLLARQRMALERLPVAIFALGPFHNKEDEFA
ncbi:flavodoxin, partial [bacterium]